MHHPLRRFCTPALSSLVAAFLIACTGGGTTDAGSDASPEADAPAPVDVPIDAGPPCTVDLDCADALFCNGTERCAPGAAGANARGCVAATSGPCGSTQTCNETLDRCESACDHADADGDGHTSVACGGDDCDDADAQRFPGNAEVCDAAGHDEDCDPATLGGATDRDRDSDTFVSAMCCNVQPGGAMRCGDDCDDTQTGVHPGAIEVCNGRDDNCNTEVDEGDVQRTFYPDADGDGFGAMAGTPMRACTPPAGTAENNTDCDDTQAARHPGATEVCNGIDDDCNGSLDGPLEDDDHDGHANAICAGVRGDDCDDTSPTTFGGAPELCDGRDNNCDGGGGVDTREDADGDHHAAPTAACTGGYPKDDCNDSIATIYAGAPEHCDGVDENCNGTTDDSPVGIDTDPNNCGSCGHRCGVAGSCGGGVCDVVVEVAAGAEHSCALRGGGGVACWGTAVYGALGNGSFSTGSPTPVAVSGLRDAVEIDAGEYHTCARRADGTVVCWGNNSSGQLGDGTTTARAIPVAAVGLAGATQLATGREHSCARRSDGTVVCWGNSQYGRLGTATIDYTRPNAVVGLSDATTVAAGASQTCAQRAAGPVVCWGHNNYGQVGDGSQTDRATPVAAVALGSGVTALAAGGPTHTAIGGIVIYDGTSCAVQSGQVLCWGRPNGYDGLAMMLTPTVRTGVSGAAGLTVGGGHTCAWTGAGALYCWGSNGGGQLGDGTTSSTRDTPALVSGLGVGTVLSAAAGVGHTCAVRVGGTVACWGSNTSGQLGDGTTTARTMPVTVPMFP